MDCRDDDSPHVSVALDRRSGAVEEAVSSRQPNPSRLRLHRYLTMAHELAGQTVSMGQHTPVVAVNALLWTRGFERADHVLPDINVDTYRVEPDGTLRPQPMCPSCRAILAGVSENGTSPAPTSVPEIETPPAAPADTVPHIYLDDLDRTSPPELRRLARVIDDERGNAAILMVDRDPALRPETALDTLLSNPPPALENVAPEGGGFLPWPDAPTTADLDEIELEDARGALRAALGHALAYDDEVLPPARAAELADAVLATLGPDSQWWTNSDIGRATGRREGVGPPGGTR